MKNNSLLRLTATFLAAIISLTAIASCSDTADTTDTSTTTGTTAADNAEDTTVPDDIPGFYKDGLETVDYAGYSFRVYSRDDTWFNGNISVEELNGEGMNDAVYGRNLAVSDRFNIEIVETVGTNTDLARATVIANEDAFDMINARCTAALSMAQEGILIEISDLPNINLSKPYWDDSLTNDLAMGPFCYFAVGDLNLTFYDYTSVLLFNKQLVDDFQLESPYELVDANKWTFDKYLELASASVSDLDGNGTMNNQDLYGTIGTPHFVGYTLALGTGVKSINKDANNYPVYEIETDAKFIEVFERVFEIMWDSGQWFQTTITDQTSATLVNMFKNNQGLFFSTNFFNVPSLRDMDTEFGILPFPKYNEAQENFITRISFFDMFAVPITVADPDRTSRIIEALTCESGNTVIPAYYDIALKTKIARDEQSQAMLDLIMANRVIDCGDTIWVDLIRDSWLAPMFLNNNRTIVSTAAKFTKTIGKRLDAMIETFEKIKG